MSILVTFNGSTFIIPTSNEVGWGTNLDNYFIAIAAGALQKTGGSFTLSGEVDFGASFGLKSLYYKSRSSNVSSTGIVRLNNNSDAVSWRNAANNGDLPLTVNTSDQLLYNGNTVLIGASPSGYVTSITGTANQVIASSPDGNVTLSLPQSINTSANVQFGTLGLGSSTVTSSILSLTSTTLGFLPPRMTQAQRDLIATPASGLTIYNTDTNLLNNYNGVAWVALTASGGGTVNAGLQNQLGYYAANGTTISGLTLITGNRALVSNASGLPIASVTTDTEITYVSGVTSAIQTQINTKSPSANPTFTGVASFASGSVAAPSITFTGDTDTGIYRPGANDLGLVVAGALSLDLQATQINSYINGTLVLELNANRLRPQNDNTLQLGSITQGWSNVYLGPGTVSLPAVSFSSDNDTGIYSGGSNVLAFSTNGGLRLSIENATTTITNVLQVADGNAASPEITFSADADTGIYRAATNTLGFTAGATAFLTGSTTLITAFLPIGTADGSASTPAHTFSADLDTGMYRSGANTLDFATGGTQAISVNSSQQLDMHSHKIVSLANGTASSDAAAFGQIFTGFQAPVHFSTTSDTANATTTFTASALTASMTLTNSAHRVAIWASGQSRNNTAGGSTIVALFRDTTNLDDATSGQMSSKVTTSQDTAGLTLLGMASPGDTASHSYTVYLKTNGTGTAHFVDGATAHIILMEVV